MARTRAARPKKGASESGDIVLDFGTVSEKQQQFLDADTFFVCYGGARGGGKTHVARLKAVGLCIAYPGIKILMVRAHYNELEENLIRPIRRWLPKEIYGYNGSSHLLTFENESSIKFGHWDGDDAENEYQGMEFDVIFLEEATQLSERAFQYLQSCIRGVNNYPKRMYLTCNPGGVGHTWVKRLFIDKRYRIDPNDPERNEDPKDYTFIFATVDDNPWILESSPMYLKNLANLPEDIRQAHRYGDWDALSGSYFKNFSPVRNVFPRFAIPKNWPIYRSLDYGFDMLAVGWWAVDQDGRCWCFREFEEKRLIVQDAAAQIRANTLPTERVETTYVPPDMWNKQKDTGKSLVDLYLENGIVVTKSNNNRVQGHMIMKNMMSPIPLTDPFVKSLFKEGQAPAQMPGLMFFNDLEKVIDDIVAIQRDDKNPNDCSKEPHEVTHTVDMCVSADTLIATPNGNIPIAELTEEGECYAWDEEAGEVKICRHSPSFMTRKEAEVFEIELDNGEKIKATAEHRFLTAAGWKRMDELDEGDELLSAELPCMAKIVKKRYAGIEPVYNMEVFGLHNYITPLGAILHNCRYFCVSRVLGAETETKERKRTYEDEEEFVETDYQTWMCGGNATESYIGFAG